MPATSARRTSGIVTSRSWRRTYPKAEAAREITDLPQYIDQYLVRLITEIGRIDDVGYGVSGRLNGRLHGAVEAEKDSIRHGSQQSLIEAQNAQILLTTSIETTR